MAHRDVREGKWRGNWWMEWVASTLHTSSEHGVSSITTADAHTSTASSRLNWRPVADLNGLVRFAERRNLVSARVPSHFKSSLPIAWPWIGRPDWIYYCKCWLCFRFQNQKNATRNRVFCELPNEYSRCWKGKRGTWICEKKKSYVPSVTVLAPLYAILTNPKRNGPGLKLVLRVGERELTQWVGGAEFFCVLWLRTLVSSVPPTPGTTPFSNRRRCIISATVSLNNTPTHIKKKKLWQQSWPCCHKAGGGSDPTNFVSPCISRPIETRQFSSAPDDRANLWCQSLLICCQWILYTWVRASWIEFNICPTRWDLFSLLHFCRQLYTFRVLTPIIRS